MAEEKKDAVFTNRDLMRLIERCAREYRIGANDSLRRNSHMNENVMDGRRNVPQKVIDALLADFINYMGAYRGMDMGFYTKHLIDKR